MKCALLLYLLAMAGAVNGQDSAEARAILDKVSQAARTGRSYRAEFNGSLETKGTGVQQKIDLVGTLIFQQPDKLRMEVRMGPSEALMVRDGAVGWVYLPALNQYTKINASPGTGANTDLAMLFGDVTGNVRVARLGAEESVSFGGVPTRCYFIQTESDLGVRDPSSSVSPMKSTLWVDQTNYMVLKRRSTWTTQAARLPTPVESTMEFALTSLTWSPTLTGTEFTFTPPPGATEIANGRAANPQPASGGPPQQEAAVPPRPAKPRGPERATIMGESVPMYSKMSATSPVVAVLHQDDTVTIEYSVGGSNGGWCAVTQAVAGGKSGNVSCDSLRRELSAQPEPSPATAPATAAAPVEPRPPITRASHIPRAPLNVRVYFVPIGNLPFVDVPYLVRYYQQRFGLTVTPLPAMALDNRTFNAARGQHEAGALIRSMQTAYPELARDGRSVLIGITDADIYIATENWSFALGFRGPDRFAVVSSARMDLNYFDLGGARDPMGLHNRLTKMISREIGFLYYKLPFSSDPQSVLRPPLEAAEDLDQIGEDF